ncbi:MAG: class I SAM-dependent methyltransferase [Blastocatellia bacterium]
MLKNVYNRVVFPRILDRMLGSEPISELRRESLLPARGRTLEIGFGTGLNLPCFPPAVTALTIIDSELMLEQVVAERIAQARIPVERLKADARYRLPFTDQSFDCVVTTFTLCSIDRLETTLAEIRRILRPGAPYIFLEHGRSDLPAVAAWQDRLNPVQRIVGAGCNLNRPIDQLITGAGLRIDRLDRLLLPHAPRLIGEIYRGTARSV